MTDLTPLIERLEKAEAGSRELDALLWNLVDPRPLEDCDGTGALYKRDPDDSVAFDIPPEFSQSLDAAIALAERVLPGESYDVQLGVGQYRPSVIFLNRETGVWRHSRAPTPALALCIALLRALKALQNKESAA